MAIASRWLAAHFNRPGFELFTHRVYAIASDGDMMEGVSHEAASIAGHLKLSNLCWVYDNNHITIEGSTALALGDDPQQRFRAYGWHTVHVTDANDLGALGLAFAEFDAAGKPTLIVMDSHIGYGAPTKHDSREAHGEPLGEAEVRGAKRFYGWPEDAQFLVPDGVRERFAECVGQRGAELRVKWKALHNQYRAQFPAEAAQLDLLLSGRLPDGWDRGLPEFPADAKGLATRDSSGKVQNALAKNIPWLLGGSADLAPSTKTLITFEGAGDFEAGNYAGRNFHFGIREHSMGAIVNGMALSHLRPYGSTFLIFSDYERAPIRLASLMELPVIQVFTHDSIGLGEDGPTHQPVEQLLALRAIPGMTVIRPADANEVLEAWKVMLTLGHHPAMLVLTRQALPTFDRARYAPAAGLARGAYVMADAPGGAPEVVLIGTGSEVSMCAVAHEQLTKSGVRSRLVSMPSWELFDRQPREYRDRVLPPSVTARVAVEQASVMGWDRWVGPHGTVIGMHTFGASAPIKDLQRRFGFEPEKIVAAALALLGR
jgi:transketolase